MHVFFLFLQDIGGSIICIVWLSTYIYNATTLASIYILVAFNIEIYFAIAHSINHKKIFNNRSVTVIVIAIWCASIVYPLAIYLSLSRVVNGLCYVAYNWQKWGSLISIVNFMIRFIIPGLAFLMCYLLILKFLLRRKRRVHGLPLSSSPAIGLQPNPPDIFGKARSNVAITLLYTLIFHFVTTTGNQILVLLYAFGYFYDTTSMMPQLFVLAMYISSCINPFVYTAKYELFRRAVRNTLYH